MERGRSQEDEGTAAAEWWGRLGITISAVGWERWGERGGPDSSESSTEGELPEPS